MLQLNAELQQNTKEILEQVRAVYLYARRDNADIAWVSFSCTEIALLAFSAADEMTDAKEVGDRLLQTELSSCLHQIALHCVDLQVWEEKWSIEYHLKQMMTHCRSIARMMGMPFDEEPEETVIHLTLEPTALTTPAETRIAKARKHGAPAAANEEEQGLSTLPLPKDRIELLKLEIKALRELLTRYVLARDNLVLVESKELEARYMEEMGYLEAEVYREESNVRYLKRKLELMQAALNRKEKIDQEAIHAALDEQYQAYRKVYEEYVKRAREATEAARARRKKVHEAQRQKQPDDLSADVKNPGDDTARSAGEEEQDEQQRLKKLYRKIVKAMHPDLHPDQDERTKELFKKAIRAYEEGDLHALEEIALMMDGDIHENVEDLLGALLKEKERLLSLIHAIREEIRLIRSRHPFDKKTLLDNPKLLKAEREKLTRRLENAKQRAKAYQEKIDEVLNGRADPKAK